jgi:hypothetical protein
MHNPCGGTARGRRRRYPLFTDPLSHFLLHLFFLHGPSGHFITMV